MLSIDSRRFCIPLWSESEGCWKVKNLTSGEVLIEPGPFNYAFRLCWHIYGLFGDTDLSISKTVREGDCAEKAVFHFDGHKVQAAPGTLRKFTNDNLAPVISKICDNQRLDLSAYEFITGNQEKFSGFLERGWLLATVGLPAVDDTGRPLRRQFYIDGMFDDPV